ncbi:MAG: hypothetical protein KBC16_03945 [Candidatus Pacebacteria bacterium]|nr:hypothetical protein [Candidatus Paceibacterota bacterium]
MNIGVWGDSITYGSCDSEALGWVGRLRKARSADKDYDATYNYGLCGDTSDNLLSRFEGEFNSNVYGVELVIFAIGLNDSSVRGNDDEFIVPVDRFRENVKKLVTQGLAKGPKVCVVGLTNVDETRTVPLAGSSTQKKFLNENVVAYDAVLKEVAEESGVTFISVFGTLSSSELADGLHPNEVGYEKLFKIISKRLEVFK